METWLLFFSAVVFLGIGAQWIAWKLRVPSILILLGVGFVAGQFFDQKQLVGDEALFALVSLSVAVIMLEGGLTLQFRELKESGKPLLRLIGPGAAITWVLAGGCLHFLAGFSPSVSALVGAILVVTGPTVIGPLLRNVRPRRQLHSILKWEGIVIDPIGAILAVLVFGALFGHGDHSSGWGETAMNLGSTLLIGFGFGFAAAKGLVFLLRRHWIPDYLHSVVILAVGIALFTASNLLQHESGLLTVTILGIGLANQAHTPVRHIIEFKENLRIILISCLFIVLGGRVGWQEVAALWKEIAMLVLALIVVVRPVSVFLSLAGTEVSVREKAFLALMAPRGIVAAAVSAIFALELAGHGKAMAAEAARIVPVVFGVIFGTVTFYGLLAAPVARKLGLATPNPQGILFAGVSPWAIRAATALQEAGFRVLMIDANYAANQGARMAGLETVNASVISDYATEEVDLAGIGRFLAVTPNDEVNSLACISFGHALGRSNVYQLQPADAESSERKASSNELSGRRLFGEGVTFQSLQDLENRDAVIRQTLITEEFTLEHFQEEHGAEALPLFVIRASGNLTVITDESLPAGEGDTLVTLVPGSGEPPDRSA